ncbi:PAS domain S-box-containing protein/diguanylate cyclase (GGDEF) domain-containing protein [Stappia sp. ES.058]|nr:PAS domain S-box-containing protein/diguanylate cyclase (GGDEF) domain-containing protein [Stappia sp. ES.058]
MRKPEPETTGSPSTERAETSAEDAAWWPIAVDREVVRSTIIEMNRAGVFVCDRNYRIWDVDGAFLDMEGMSRADVIGRTVEEILGSKVFSLRRKNLDEAFAGKALRIRVPGVRDKTLGKFLEVFFQPVFDRGEEVVCVICAVRDVTQFQHLNERLSMHEEILRQTTDRISVIGTDFRYKMTNAANAAFSGKTPDDFVGLHVRDHIGAERFDKRAKAHFERCFAGQSVEYEHELPVAGQEPRHIRVRMDPYRDDEGSVTGALIVLRDITEAARLAKKLRRQAREDALTGLANRHALREELERVLDDMQSCGKTAALLTIDLDGFKVVNDIAGHSGGDALLQQIAGLLRSFASQDMLCARLGGDEFAVLAPGVDAAAARDLGHRITSGLASMRFVWQDVPHAITASVGIALIEPAFGAAPEKSAFQVLNEADQACLHAKSIGGARPVVYRPDAEEMVAHRLDIGNLQIVRNALESDRLELYTMPILPIDGASAPHMEVLLRIVDDHGRVLAPAALITSAERHGLMPRIDRWVVATALENLHTVDPRTCLTINLSGLSIGDPEFTAFLLETLDTRPDAAGRLAFEITETAAVRSMVTAQALIAALRTRNCRIILDDFGSGLSSFAYLRQFCLDSLKVDGAIIGEVAHDEVQRTIVAGIVAVARKLGIGVIAEYVEDAETLAILRDLGVTMAQGYYIGRPAPWVGARPMPSQLAR